MPFVPKISDCVMWLLNACLEGRLANRSGQPMVEIVPSLRLTWCLLTRGLWYQMTHRPSDWQKEQKTALCHRISHCRIVVWPSQPTVPPYLLLYLEMLPISGISRQAGGDASRGFIWQDKEALMVMLLWCHRIGTSGSLWFPVSIQFLPVFNTRENICWYQYT